MRVETEGEAGGRWIAEVPSIPGAMVYAATRKEAVAKGRSAASTFRHTDASAERAMAADAKARFRCLGRLRHIAYENINAN
jgi:hypothetical protein